MSRTTEEEIVQKQLEYYNAQDIEGFLSTYAENVQILDHPSGEVRMTGREEMKASYTAMFAMNPNNRCAIKNRTVFGNFVIDLEEITGRDNRDPYQALAIYEVKEGLISRVWFLEKEE